MMDKEILWGLLKDSISEGVLLTDLHLNVLELNKNLEIMLELDNWQGKHIRDVLPWRVCFALEKVINDMEINGICVFPQKFNFITQKGVIIPLLVLGEQVFDETQERAGYLFIFRDTIVQEEIGTMSWANALKTAYLTDISKNFYRPLHNLDKILTDFVDYTVDSLGEDLETLKPAFKEVEALRALYDRLLDHMRIDMICNKLVLSEVSVERLFRDTVNFLLTSKVRDRLEISSAGDTHVLTDLFKLEQLLVNFIDILLGKIGNQRIRVDLIGSETEVEINFVIPGGVWPELQAIFPVEEGAAWQKSLSLEENLIRYLLSRLKISARLDRAGAEDKEIIRISVPREL